MRGTLQGTLDRGGTQNVTVTRGGSGTVEVSDADEVIPSDITLNTGCVVDMVDYGSIVVLTGFDCDSTS